MYTLLLIQLFIDTNQHNARKLVRKDGSNRELLVGIVHGLKNQLDRYEKEFENLWKSNSLINNWNNLLQ